MGYRKNPLSLIELRCLAKQRLLGHGPDVTTALALPEVQRLFEELEIHQIELELQNEYLNTARAQLEVALNQSGELYDFSPVSILSLDQTGIITKLNLAGANLLEGARARLLGNRFELYVADADVAVLNALLAQATASGDVQGGEIALARKGPLTTFVQVQIAQLPEELGWQLILLDITEHRQNEAHLRVSEERWQLALEAAGDGVWDWNVQTGDMLFSKRFEQLFGFEENEYGHHLENWLARLHPDDKQRVMGDSQAYLDGKSDRLFNEHREQCKNGSWKWVFCRGAIVSRTAEGKPLRMVGTHVDITNKKQTEEALLSSVRFQQTVFDSLSAQIAVLDRHGTVIQTNAAWWKYAIDNELAETPSFGGSNYLEILDCLTAQDQETVLAASAGIASVASGEVSDFQLPHPFYTPLDKRWFTMKVTPVHDVEERVVVSHEDVTRLKAAELASLTLANIDALTGALSRRNFLNLAEQELARAARYELPLMVLMLDLDHFKHINDHHGHAAGDVVLQAFVKTVAGVLRESDLIGRIGGEEFAVLLPSTTLEGGRSLAQRIIESVRTSPVEVNGALLSFTVSIGAGCLSSETSFANLLGLADVALYKAKNGGRDRLEVGLA
ncbi:MAG: diguanylate cyclase [Rhodoferax sp.]|uniref:sensor domain-containing diguanylate cyclase n=1 Tax=Rhodoferax sp. TaxID=50421 RepID=UPI0017E3E9B5|nr:sensor domain-containing diguanylate cyclase [Rhodoferax sp.]NMM15039.1 diguanylate cyclase [Rhodoferax sp.]